LTILPIRFKPGEVKNIEWTELLVDFNSLPQCFKIVVPYLVAAVVYHRQFLCTNLQSSHPLFTSRFWRNGYQEKLKDAVLGPVRMKCTITGMSATGVSQQTAIHYELRAGLEEFKKQQESKEPLTVENVKSVIGEVIRHEIKEALQQANINGSSSSASMLQEQDSRDSSSPLNEQQQYLGRISSYANWNWGNPLKFGRPLPPEEHFPAM
jgi:hypothetical protein